MNVLWHSFQKERRSWRTAEGPPCSQTTEREDVLSTSARVVVLQNLDAGLVIACQMPGFSSSSWVTLDLHGVDIRVLMRL